MRAGLVLLLPCWAWALPQSPVPIAGSCESRLASPEVLEIMVSDQAVVEWKEFSIGETETARFVQPHSEAIALNRVMSAEPSLLMGRLEANGQVVLVNPNGIVVGREARIDAGSFVASAFDLQTDLFLRNKEIAWVGGGAGRIENRGQIKAGRIELQGPEIYLFETAACDASGLERGGEILVGDREHTDFIWAQEGSLLSADAGMAGPGGEIFVVSRGANLFSGQISAQGGPLGGEGGFAEVSGGYLSYLGFADLRAEKGRAGTLLLDPTDITITAAVDANNTTAAGFTFPLTCGGNSDPSTRNETAAGFPTSSVSVATLTVQIGGGSVIIDSTGGVGGSGNITWNAAANFSYTSANDLILRAPAGAAVSILSRIQNAGTGNVVIDSLGPTVLINQIGNNQSVSFGSLDGLTQICAPNADVILQASTGGINRYAQLGFTAGDGVTANGPIAVECSTLSLFGSSSTQSFAHIGHGQIGNVAALSLFTTPSAAITINAAGDIVLQASSSATAGTNAAAIIGHGDRNLQPPMMGPLSLLQGDITVIAGGAMMLLSNPGAASQSCSARIGHGINGGLAGSDFQVDADIFVQAAGDIAITSQSGGPFHHVGIGHFSSTGTLAGDLTVLSGGSIRIDGNPIFGLGFRVAIGHLALGAGSATGNLRVFACQDIALQPFAAGVFGIGAVNASALNFAVGDVAVAAGRDISIAANGASNVGRIGNNYSGPGTATNTFVSAGRDIILSGTSDAGIGGFGDIYVSAGRDVSLSANAAGAILFLGTDDSTNVLTPRTTRVFATGSVIASNPAATGRSIIGRGLTPAASYGSSLDVRAGGDIQLSSPYNITAGGVVIPTSGSIFLEADAQLPPGALWSAGGGQISSICQVSPNLPILISPVCPAAAIGADAPAIPADGLGGLRFDTGGNGGSFGLQTTLGSITLHSAPVQASGASQNLTIGTGLNNANILTTSGNIEIWGSQNSSDCVRGDSFYDIFLDQPLSTTGSVLISANNSLTMTAVSSIDTSAGSGAVTLIVDNQAPFSPLIGAGRFVMLNGSAISTGAGLLQIYTALQGSNAIDGSLNGMSFSNGTLFSDSNQEIWCTYFCAPLMPGFPFTVSYKNCLQEAAVQATIIVDQFLVDLHPYNEFPGWVERFWFKWESELAQLSDLPFFIRRRHLNIINHPKSYTQLTPE